jgi:DNA-binding transcriptional LysR family regulator
MKIEPRDIEYFAVVAERGHVGRAAEAVGLTQPALSKSLRRLERALGAKLVERTPKGVDLTAVGAALFFRAQRLRLSLEDLAREAADLSQGRGGQLRVGASPGLSVNLLPVACAAMLREAPQVMLKITVATSEIVVPALSRGELDLIVKTDPLTGDDDLVQEHLYERAFVVLASARHKLARKKHVTLADLAQERWILAASGPSRETLCRAFARIGLPPPTVAVESSSVPLRLHLLPSTDLLGFGPRQFFREGPSHFGLTELRVKGLSSAQSIGVSYRKDAYLSPVAQRFIAILKTTAKEIA